MEDYKKKYEEKLSKAKTLHNLATETSHDDIRMVLEELFDELKESEDERVRKALIHYFSEQDGILTAINGSVSVGDILAWLEGEKVDVIENFDTEFEKQVSHLIASAMDKEHEYTKGYVEWVAQSLLGYAKNERTSIDEIKPKFKVGDWVVSPNGVYWHIDYINNNRYEVSSTNGACADWPLDTDLYHLWTIKDAKDGDVLVASDGSIFIFKEIRDYGCKHYIALEDDGKTINVNNNLKHYWETIDSVKPSTKEQCDLLFQKMKEAGYEWDAEKKELKKIEQCENYHCCGEVDNEALQKTLQIWFDKGKCSGRDEVIFHPEKFGLQKQVGQKPAWSEEDKMQLDATIHLVSSTGHIETTNWLKNLKDRVQLQPKQKWSEEEKARIDKIIDVLDWAEEKGRISYSDWEDYVCYVKSLKPQNTWKSSEEQMEVLYKYAEQNNHDGSVLTSLYQDLKKLK